jgi:hypothetical protein
MDHLHVAITWAYVVWETVPCVDGPKQVVQVQIQSSCDPCCHGSHLSWSSSHVGSGLFMNLLNEVSMLTSINVNMLLHR